MYLETSSLEITKSARRPLSFVTRATFFYAGVLLPAICFLLATGMGFEGDWQSGNLDDILCYLLVPPAALPIYPLVLYPMVCMTLLVINESHARHFVVRLGIYGALLSALQYGFVLYLSIGPVPNLTVSAVASVLFAGAVAIVCGFVAFALLRWVVPLVWRHVRKLPQRVRLRWSLILQWLALAVVTLFAVIVVFGTVPLGEVISEAAESISGVFIFGSLAAAPFWAFAVYAVMGLRIYHRQPGARQFSLAQVLLVISWFSAHLAAWRWGLRLAMIEYAKLPTEPPSGCYVVTAASRGHGWWVGTGQQPLAAGRRRVNNQMRYLKAAELALAEASPRWHRRVRTFYDRVGPRWASRLHDPLAADAAYTMLKPAEWLARLLLTALVPDFDRLARGLYRDAGRGMPACRRRADLR
ncbi:MAG: hypothetical protein OES79_00760 [Planctomycetota bacterium]|nr:hypothetical protein [Planctomycetota bacterium]